MNERGTMILVRHAQPEIDPAIAPTEWTLSAAGRSQAATVALSLQSLAPDAIHSSPERKARETADILGAALALDVTVVPELREHDREGVPFLHTPGAFEEHVRRVFALPHECAFGNESGTAALERFRRGIVRVAASGARQPIIVSHGTVMSLFIAAELGLDAWSVWERLRLPEHWLLDGGSVNQMREE